MTLTSLFHKIKNVLRKAYEEQIIMSDLQQQQPQQPQPAATVGNKITKLILQTQFLRIELTDPNVLDELNTPEKYAQNLGFISSEFNINKHGGRIAVVIEDRKEVLREILSGVSRNETSAIQNWTVERAP